MSVHRRNASEDIDPFGAPEDYYGANTNPIAAPKSSRAGRTRTFSVSEPLRSHSGTPEPPQLRRGLIVPIHEDPGPPEKFEPGPLRRRGLLDERWTAPRQFYIASIDDTLEQLLQSEDTDHNYQITIEDTGPKVLRLGTANSNGFRQAVVRGTYMLLNLLQELTIAKRFGRREMILDERRLEENPVARMRRLILGLFWKALTRKVTPENIADMARDTKICDEYVDASGRVVRTESVRIYVPYDRPDQLRYFCSIRDQNPQLGLDVQQLPQKMDAEYIRSINKRPGLLALEAKQDPNDPTNLLNEPYVVPGGRFNELYGWDSYMMVLGLLLDVTPAAQTNLRLARGMTENFIYEIHHYHKILNANRLYYLGRSQPPFLTDMARRIYDKTLEVSPTSTKDMTDFLKRATLAAIKEYNTVWCAVPRLDEETGLSCYHPEGSGVPPETEASHFDAVLRPYVEKYGISQAEFIERYNNHELHEPALDEYFLHDRAVRESGHDTSYRLEGKAAYLATVDLNSLLYKYEVDIADFIRTHFGGELATPWGTVEKPEEWEKRAAQRKVNMTKYLWNEQDSIYYDYHVREKQQNKYESATCFWPLWAGAASEDQADKLVKNSLCKFEEAGGLVSGTLASRGEVSINRPSRQWDYPYAWAPHQMLAWIGLSNYHYGGAARRLAYRWLFMMTRAFVDYNGVVVEKYNVIKGAVPHKVDAEYGNQGADFKGVATEGFGWVNASYLLGLTYLNLQAHRSIGALVPPDVFFANLSPSQKELYE